MKGRAGCDFSFSGLKTAVRMAVADMGTLSAQQRADVCASFQHSAAESLCDRTKNAMQLFRATFPHGGHFVLAGGVAANQYLRGRLEALAEAFALPLVAPPVPLCTDNAAMIAWAGVERFRLGMVSGLDFEPRARWPLAA
jgi:N6-L-threonylcarbamoyladenine synthase